MAAHSLRHYFFNIIMCVGGLMVGLWAGVHITQVSLLANEINFAKSLRIVQDSLANDDIDQAHYRVELYLDDRDLQLDDLYTSSFFLPDTHRREWRLAVETRAKTKGAKE